MRTRSVVRSVVAVAAAGVLVAPAGAAQADPLPFPLPELPGVPGLPVPALPGAPTDVTAEPGDGQATISWTAPAELGTPPLTGYVVSRQDMPLVPACVAGAEATSCVVTGLTNGTAYTFTVAAMTLVLPGEASEPVTVTPQAVLESTTAPRISGDARVGKRLTVSSGEWADAEGATFAYEWRRDGSPIAGATGTTYQVAPADNGHRLSVEVTATLEEREGTATTGAVKILPGDGPRASARPRLLGTAKVGQRLRVGPVDWSMSPDQVTYRWFVGGERLDGATRRGLKVRRAFEGDRVHAVVTAKVDGYFAGKVRSKVRTVR
jgi:hypothetical protein